MENHKIIPICACCREAITGLWVVTQPKVYVLCAKGTCEGWARSQGLTLYARGTTTRVAGPRRPPARTRTRPTCDHCGEPRRAIGDCFVVRGRVYCTLTCQLAAQPAGSR